MDFISTIILAIGLAMDAVAVSISSSIALNRIKIIQALKMAFFFGLFQAIMPLLGWLAGVGFRNLIQGIDHWIAFILLSLIGGKMIIESIKSYKGQVIPKQNPLNFHILLGLSIATSIDALAAGVSFAVLKLNILLVICIIGTITFLLSFVAAWLGKKLGYHFGSRVEFIGGLILIAIGLKILIEHMSNHI